MTTRKLSDYLWCAFLCLCLWGPLSESASASGDNTVFFQTPNPLDPRVPCSFVPMEFLECKDPLDHKGNKTARDEAGHGCVKFGGLYYEQVERTKVQCQVLPDIECYGSRTFLKDGFPCIRYTTHYFLTTLLYSILLGFLGMDRFCLGNID